MEPSQTKAQGADDVDMKDEPLNGHDAVRLPISCHDINPTCQPQHKDTLISDS